MSTVYLNGEYLAKEDAKISPDDRGFLLGDGLYEVAAAYEGVLFGFEEHIARLLRGLCWMRIDYDTSGLEEVFTQLIARNGLESADRSLVYLQITRGAAPRTHYFPKEAVEPTVYAYAKEWSRPSDERWDQGFTAATVPDRRWSRVDIKTICLLPNAIGFQDALEKGADDAILVRDGVAIEGAHQNFWAVFGDTAVTHPKTNQILPGITRDIVLEEALAAGMSVEERPIQIEELAHADEAFFTGTTGEVRPVVEIDGSPVGSGRVGDVTRRLSDLFLARVEAAKEAARAGSA